MNKSMIQSGGYVLLAGLILAMSSTLFAADNNLHFSGNLGSDSNLLIVFYVQIMPDDLVMQLHR
ncbi:hypothetical protein HAN01_11245, partial [Escherichia coli]|nr:hypothetical protein [Escherichia coli]